MKRLLLFDIDGTLLSTNGAARRAFHRGLLQVYGTAGPIDELPFDGKTDPQIARELLRAAGLEDQQIDRNLPALWDSYLGELEQEIGQADYQTTVYPGVHALLAKLSARSDVVLALLTGNVARGAELKLGSAGLREYFGFGAFGSDCEDRAGLPRIAVQRARQRLGREFDGHNVVVIGDTPSDIRCGESLGVFTVAVATGRHDRRVLEAEGAHVVFDDLSDTPSVLRALLPAA